MHTYTFLKQASPSIAKGAFERSEIKSKCMCTWQNTNTANANVFFGRVRIVRFKCCIEVKTLSFSLNAQQKIPSFLEQL